MGSYEILMETRVAMEGRKKNFAKGAELASLARKWLNVAIDGYAKCDAALNSNTEGLSLIVNTFGRDAVEEPQMRQQRYQLQRDHKYSTAMVTKARDCTEETLALARGENPHRRRNPPILTAYDGEDVPSEAAEAYGDGEDCRSEDVPWELGQSWESGGGENNSVHCVALLGMLTAGGLILALLRFGVGGWIADEK